MANPGRMTASRDFGISPGKWKLQTINMFEEVHRVTADGTLFLEVSPCSDGYSPGESLANAKAIAALPEILCALRDSTYCLESSDDASHWASQIAENNAILNRLAKKKGV